MSTPQHNAKSVTVSLLRGNTNVYMFMYELNVYFAIRFMIYLLYLIVLFSPFDCMERGTPPLADPYKLRY